MRLPAASQTPLLQLPMLAIDAQSSGASPATGQLIELAWALWNGPQDPIVVQSSFVALEQGNSIPPRIRRLTGLDEAMLQGAASLETLCSQLAPQLQARCLLIHFARFELAFLRPWLEPKDGRAALEALCTHALATRLLPSLPRHSLRAVAGHFGLHLGEARRAAEHVQGTLRCWHRLAELAEQRGYHSLDALFELQRSKIAPKPQRPLDSKVAPNTRLGLPHAPGIYCMLGSEQQVLYVGKAKSLHRRVNSYFQKRRGLPPSVREMLAQVCDVRVQCTPNAVEAALLEHEMIKRLDPPYNSQMRRGERQLVFFNDRFDCHTVYSEEYQHGPFVDNGLLRSLRFFVQLSARDDRVLPVPSYLASTLHLDQLVPEQRSALAEQLAACLEDGHREQSPEARVRRLGRALHTKQREEQAARALSEANALSEASADSDENQVLLTKSELEPEADGSLPERLFAHFQHLALQYFVQRTRSRRLLWLSECRLRWLESDVQHELIVSAAQAQQAGRFDGRRRWPQRRASLSLDDYDRLRVLDGELRRLCDEASLLDCRFVADDSASAV